MANTVLCDENSFMKRATLTVFGKDGSIIAYPITEIVTQLGRKTDKSRADIMLDTCIASRTHGEIIFTNGSYYYRDMNSTNGTFVNKVFLGLRSANHQTSVVLNDGDVLSFDVSVNGVHHPECVFALFTLCPLEGCEWKTVELDDTIAEICVGRSENSGLMIENEMISERHASFFAAKNGWAIIDHHSKNGVYYNGRRMNAPKYLKEYDVVRIIDTYFLFLGKRLMVCAPDNIIENQPDNSSPVPVPAPIPAPVPGPVPAPAPNPMPIPGPAPAPRPMPVPGHIPAPGPMPVPARVQSSKLVINIVERSVVSRFKKLMLLQNINLSISNGEMVLILGGSGAGKTTFINAVMGYEKATGHIEYRNTNIYEEYERMKYEIGFVPQQDLLRSSDTVYDTLSNAADMKLPSNMKEEEKERRIGIVLEELGLTREKKSLVSKLSGGQKKRLSIAVEFISSPSLFFLDEPDSGLDGIMGRGLMENLRSIANKGTIVMVITHAPDRAADLFDKVIVLAKSIQDNCGHLAFYGSVQDAFNFFEVDSLEKIVKRINRPDENGEGLSDFFIDKYSKTQHN